MRKYIGPLPQYNELRTRKVFAWLPIRIGNHRVSLEYYLVIEEYIRGMPFDGWIERRKEMK